MHELSIDQQKNDGHREPPTETEESGLTLLQEIDERKRPKLPSKKSASSCCCADDCVVNLNFPLSLQTSLAQSSQQRNIMLGAHINGNKSMDFCKGVLGGVLYYCNKLIMLLTFELLIGLPYLNDVSYAVYGPIGNPQDLCQFSSRIATV